MVASLTQGSKGGKKPICISAFVLMERCGYVLQPSRQQSELRAPSPRGLFFLSERSAVERVWLQAAFQWRYQISPIVTRHNEPSVRLAPPYYRRHPCKLWRRLGRKRWPSLNWFLRLYGVSRSADDRPELNADLFSTSVLCKIVTQGYKHTQKNRNIEAKIDLFHSKYRHRFLSGTNHLWS